MNQSSYNFPVIHLSSLGRPLVGWSVRSCSGGPRPSVFPTPRESSCLRVLSTAGFLEATLGRDKQGSRTGLPSAVLQSGSDEAGARMDLARGALRARPFDYGPSDCPSGCGFLLRLSCGLFARMSGALEEGHHARVVPNGPRGPDGPGGFRFDAPSRRPPLPVLRFPAWVRDCGRAARFSLRPAALVFTTRASSFGVSRDERFRLATPRSR